MEMNAHIPQSYESMVELEEIAAIPHHIITPRHAKPMIGVFQDTLVGSYRLTQPGIQFTRKEFMNLMMWNKRFTGYIPVASQGQRWSGQQVLSALLPPINLEMGNKSFDSKKDDRNQSENYVKITQGDIVKGVVDGDIWMKPSKGVIHVTYNDYGEQDTVDLLDALQNTVEHFLVMNGFSVGISDLIADEETKQQIERHIQEQKKQVEDVILQVHLNLFENNTGKTNQQEFEDQIFGHLNKATTLAGKVGQDSLSKENRLLAMVRSGSKGEPLNVAQMMACLGQTAIEGKRVPYGFTDRTLPHYKKYDDSPESRGFIESSFIRGLTPQQFFFHAMSGREGLIDTAVKTADTGYIQRQLIKSMEDLIVHHDGTVRDANHNIIQFHYGEDGVNPTKIETQSLSIGKMSVEEIQRDFGMVGVNWSDVLMQSQRVRDLENEAISRFVTEVLYDRRMMVEEVFQMKSLDSGSVFAPVNLARLILNVKTRMGLRSDQKTNLTPYVVLEGIQRLIQQTHSYHKIWAALLRFYLAPHKLIVQERFTKEAFDLLMELILAQHMKAWVQPGDQVGIVAAQSIGEPSTQMTLNSVDWDTQIVLAKNDKVVIPQIGEWIDSYIKMYMEDDSKKAKIQYLPNHQIYIPLEGENWKAVSCDEHGKMMWTTLEAITRHPVVNEDGTNTILKVTLASGRQVKATKGKSFLTLQNGKILERNGSDLKVGDELPIANDLDMDSIGYLYEWNLRSMLPETEYLDGSMKDSQLPETIPLNRLFGFFCGAYLAEGMSNDTQVVITTHDPVYLQPIQDLMSLWNIETHVVSEKTDRSGTSTSIIIPSTILAKVMSTMFGGVSHEKRIPEWSLQGCDDYIAGLIDGYFSGNGTVELKSGVVLATSVSYDLLIGIQFILARYRIYSTMTSRMPHHPFASVATYDTIRLPVMYSHRFASRFTLTLQEKQSQLDKLYSTRSSKSMKSKWGQTGDMIWDKIVSIEEVKPMGEGWVYDITVAKTRNFLTKTLIAQKDTFHQAGVASKSAVTRGVPRLRELLKVTQNPKATSLTIYLRPEFRDNKDKAREVVQDLELTLLRNITDKVSIYWDSDEKYDDQDSELLDFYKQFEVLQRGPYDQDSKSKWMLRMELNREEMFNRNITMQEVVTAIQADGDLGASVVYSDYNAKQMVMRIRITKHREKDYMNAMDYMDNLTDVKKLQNRLLNGIVIRGVPGIKAVAFRHDKQFVEEKNGKYESITQYVLDTDGSNFAKVMNHPAVDGSRLYSTNVWDVYEMLGIEATRAVLYNEINGLFESVGVNYRHLCLLCDVMTRFGKLMSIDRYGINKNDIGTLAKASFEETEKILLNAAVFGEVDPVTGVSANIMMGQPIRGGTAFSQIMLDDQMLPKMMNDALVKRYAGVLEEEEVGDLSELGKRKVEEFCAEQNFQSHMVLPKALPVLEEKDMEWNEVDAFDDE